MRNQSVDQYLMDMMGAAVHRAWLGPERVRTYETEFLSKGYFILPMHGMSREELLKCYEGNRVTLTDKDCAPGYYTFPFNADTIAELNKKHNFYGPPAPEGLACLEKFLESNKDLIERQMGSPFEVCNVRIEALLVGNAYGPSQWHADGGPRFLRKILMYPGPLRKDDYGALEFFDRDGKRHLLESKEPIAVLYDTSFLLHRGHPPTQQPRAMIEITLKPSRKSAVKPVFPGHLARVPEFDDAMLDPVLREMKTLRLAANAAAARAAQSPKSVAPGPLNVLIGRLARIRSFKQLLRAIGRRFFKQTTEASQMRESYDAGPLPYIGGQIANRASMLRIGPADAAFSAGWLTWDSEGADAKFAIIPAATRSMSLVYADRVLFGMDAAHFGAVLEETRRVLGLGGKLLLSLPRGKENSVDNIEALLATHGFAIETADRKTVLSQLKWIPGLVHAKRVDRYILAKSA